jgi:hypothetical protein
MRAMLCAALVAGLAFLSPGWARADDQKELNDQIEKSIKALGGRENLAKFKGWTMKVKGKATTQGMTLDMTMELMVQEPDKSKVTMDMDIMGQKINVIVVTTGDKGWQRISITNQTDDISKEQMAEYKEQAYAHRVEALTCLNEKQFKLTPLGDSKIGDADVVGIKVSSEGHRDVSLYFDKKTNLLAKTETNSKDAALGDKEFAQETFYSDYKEVQGIKHSSKLLIKRDGMEFMNGEITEWTPSEKLEDGLFVKP